MTREMIHSLGVEAGLLMEGQDFGFRFDEVAKFAALVAAAEREACAKIADQLDDMTGREIAANIKARGEA